MREDEALNSDAWQRDFCGQRLYVLVPGHKWVPGLDRVTIKSDAQRLTAAAEVPPEDHRKVPLDLIGVLVELLLRPVVTRGGVSSNQPRQPVPEDDGAGSAV